VKVRVLVITALLLIWLCCPGTSRLVRSEQAVAQGPVIRLDDTKTTIDVIGLDPIDLTNLARASLEASQWRELFAIYVQKVSKGEATHPPPVLGSYGLEQGAVRFKPRFPLAPGVRYRAVFQPGKIPGHRQAKPEPIVAEIFIAKPDKESTVVKHIYPSADHLSENHLRFYIHFSAPMRQGEAYARVHLLDAFGKQIDHPFLELDEELWDPQGKRFTLLFHPGRIKKGLKPREELGPLLETGKTYTLVIDREWSDADARPLKELYRKTFTAGAAEETLPDPKTWKIQPPSAGSSEPLTVSFPRPLDHALLERMVWVTDAQNRKVPGTAAVTERETRWQFTPERPWQAGSHHVVVDTRLEDPSGNSLRRPFEVDVFHPVERQIKVETVGLPFLIQAASPR
jgi:hypothetical protein